MPYIELTTNESRKLKQAGSIILAGGGLGVIYISFSNGFNSLYPFLNGMAVGFLVGLAISVLELGVFPGRAKKIKFITLFLLRAFLYLLIVVVIISQVVALSMSFRMNLNYLEVLASTEYVTYIVEGNFMVAVVYSLAFAVSINFVRMVSRKLGQGMLVSYISGTYNTPVLQKRYVMFIHLRNKQEVVDHLDGLNFFKFLNEVFYDITEPIIVHQGIIHEYVEDQIVVTWSEEKGKSQANVVMANERIKDKLMSLKHKYRQKFGVQPEIESAIHFGQVVRAEIGTEKTQIVCYGDVMNTCYRMLEQCHGRNMGRVISRQALESLQLPTLLLPVHQGQYKLDGKGQLVDLYTLDEADDV